MEKEKEVTSKKLNDKYKDIVGEDGIEVLEEEPRKKKKFNGLILVIIILSIIIMILGGLIFIKRDSIFTSTIIIEDETNNITKELDLSRVPAEDTYALAMGEDFGIQFYMIHNGRLYYKIDDYSAIGNFQNYRVIDFNLSASYDVVKSLNEYPSLSGIKRIKTYDFANSVSYSLILIMEDGSVYRLTYTFYSNQFSLTKLNIFGNNKVDNILKLDVSPECTSNNCAAAYEIINKDGKTITK